jgi:polyphosphate glucokinase
MAIAEAAGPKTVARKTVARKTVARKTVARKTPASRGAPFTLGVDIGGTNVKASVLDRTGALLANQLRSPTPKRATPQAVLDTIAKLAAQLPSFHRISVGFPGVVKGGRTMTAPNLGTRHWAGFELIDALSARFGTPARILNDAAVQGLGVVEGHGLECVLTLGTGVGCALFRNRRLLLHLELGQHRARKGKTYDQYVGQAALARRGPERWNERVRKVIDAVTELTSCDRLYIGGGNARKIAFAVPPHVKVVSNTAGITGGVRLWEPELDELFAGEPHARAEASSGPRGRQP